MSRRRKKSGDLSSLADELCREDGSDPREFHAKPWNAPKQATRKGRQLCAQVREALHSTLLGCADELLQGASVLSVEPAPHTGRLLVIVSAGEADRAALEAALIRAAGFLRGEVASAICRRHAPELVFDVL
ncbi:MAG: ribosome-binding factor A [Planctomycetes bacterium]|nr:ribosome-binding factor A [Planctomycetota bacterium]